MKKYHMSDSLLTSHSHEAPSSPLQYKNSLISNDTPMQPIPINVLISAKQINGRFLEANDNGPTFMYTRNQSNDIVRKLLVNPAAQIWPPANPILNTTLAMAR